MNDISIIGANGAFEDALSQLTAWNGGRPEVWRRALDLCDSPRASRIGGGLSRLRRRASTRRGKLAVGVGIAASIILIGWIGRPRGVSMGPFVDVADRTGDAQVLKAGRLLYGGSSQGAVTRRAAGATFSKAATPAESPVILGEEFRPYSTSPGQAGVDLRNTEHVVSSAIDRQIVRRATIELYTPDVQAAFAKASQLVFSAGGEYVEESSIAGAGDYVTATLVLRVGADRISDVLDQARQLGSVTSEQSADEDVTTQVVDIEARLRNETRVEAELLELLEKRQDASLKDIIALRASIAETRLEIERLTSSRQRLGRLVSLATITIIIRAERPPVEVGGFGGYVQEVLASGWNGGLAFLADTTGGLVRVLVGGSLFWILAIVVYGIVRHYRRSARRTPDEP